MVDHMTVMQGSKAAGDISLDRLSSTLAFDEAVGRVRLVSPARAKSLQNLGIFTVRDLLTHFPRRYIDMSQVETVVSATIGEMCSVVGIIHEIKLKQPKPKLSLVEISLLDKTGIMMITCFRQAWLMDSLKKGMRIAVSGKLEFNYGYKRMTNPFIEELDASYDGEAGMIIPVHSATAKISSAWMRRLISNALDISRGLYDPLPIDLRVRYVLPSRQAALTAIHFPRHIAEVEMARRRLVYEELLLLELYLMTETAQRSLGKTPVSHVVDGKYMKALDARLPFVLTEEQAAARDDLLKVMAARLSANHMVLGDVGTGKTIIAAFGLAACADSKSQALMMAPTEILARQYEQNIGPLLDEAGILWEVLTSSTSASERESILDKAKAGTIDVLFGTQALLEDDVVMKNCSFVVVDEQHRFGVTQRAKLLKKGTAPDALFLTATPIPRSLALALYGDLTLSYIKQRPRNSAGNTTKVYRRSERGYAYDAALAALASGRQVYVVCPLVGETFDKGSEKEQKKEELFESSEGSYEYAAVSIEAESDFDNDNLKAAKQEADFLQAKTFIDYKVGLLHGKMSGAAKQEIMQSFRAGETQVLVATTVIEVGVDVPNASVMIVEDADRFGLAQLHQLRGRVGRGSEAGEVFLISGSKSPVALERLEAMEKTEDGFELASYDLSLRREGDILGNRQHGASVLKLVNVIRDSRTIEAAHSDAAAILEADPTLKSPSYRSLGREMRLLFSDSHKLEGG